MLSQNNSVEFSLKSLSPECVQNILSSEIKQDIELYGMSPVILLCMCRKKNWKEFTKILLIVVVELD